MFGIFEDDFFPFPQVDMLISWRVPSSKMDIIIFWLDGSKSVPSMYALTDISTVDPKK